MTKLYRVLGKRGRITIPYEIRRRVGFIYRTCAGKLRPVEVYFGANAEACKTAESRIFFAPSGRRTAAERATAGKYTA